MFNKILEWVEICFLGGGDPDEEPTLRKIKAISMLIGLIIIGVPIILFLFLLCVKILASIISVVVIILLIYAIISHKKN